MPTHDEQVMVVETFDDLLRLARAGRPDDPEFESILATFDRAMEALGDERLADDAEAMASALSTADEYGPLVDRHELETLIMLVARTVGDLREELAELRSGAVRTALADAHKGKWLEHERYTPGDLATWGGNTWLCAEEAVGEEPGKSAKWKLFAQRGRDGRDRRT